MENSLEKTAGCTNTYTQVSVNLKRKALSVRRETNQHRPFNFHSRGSKSGSLQMNELVRVGGT